MTTIEEQLRRYGEHLERVVPHRTPTHGRSAPLPRGRPQLRLLGAAVAVVVVVGAGTLVWAATRDDGSSETVVLGPPATPAPTNEPPRIAPTAAPPSTLPGPPTTATSAVSTKTIPAPIGFDPEEREAFSQVWTGEELIVFGGRAAVLGPQPPTYADGWALDLERETWRSIAQSAAPRSDHVGVWLDSSMYVVGGTQVAVEAYDPRTDTWRQLPDAPIDLSHQLERGFGRTTAVAVGGRLAVWAGVSGNGAMYDPASDSWRMLPGSSQPNATTKLFAFDDRLVVMTAAHLDNTLRGVVIDIDEWQAESLPPLEFEAQTGGMSWTGWAQAAATARHERAVLAWIGLGGEMRAWRFDVDDQAWTETAAPALPSCEAYADAISAGSRLLVNDDYCAGSLVIFDPETGTTTPVDSHVWGALWTGTELLGWGPLSDGSDDSEPYLSRQVLPSG